MPAKPLQYSGTEGTYYIGTDRGTAVHRYRVVEIGSSGKAPMPAKPLRYSGTEGPSYKDWYMGMGHVSDAQS